METSAAAERYARALFDQAQQDDALTAIREDMQAINGLIRDSEVDILDERGDGLVVVRHPETQSFKLVLVHGVIVPVVHPAT